jgi:plasmid stabilization system protein ParE
LSLAVVYRPKVGRDLAAGFEYYERQGAGLGERFLAAMESAFDAIERYPTMFSSVHGDVRRAIVTGFPYAVFYRVEKQRTVVLTVLHTARDPKLWPRAGMTGRK